MTILLEDVFKLSGVPKFNFVEPHEYSRLFVSLRSKGRGVVVEGPSGIGKTTCVLQILDKLGETDNVKVYSGRKKKDLPEIQNLLNFDDFGTVVIDDFHRLNVELRNELSDLLKTLADEEDEKSKLVLVGINKTGKSLIDYASDLRNRVDIIKFESNPDEKVEELLSKGEQSLNITLNIKKDIANDAQGSFHLAQMLAHHACLKDKILEKQKENTATSVSYESLKETILDDLALSFSDITTNFCKGQRVKKGSRAPYFHILLWLSQSNDMTINIESSLVDYPRHKNSVGQIITKGHLSDHYQSKEQYADVLHYNEDTTQLSIEDPKYFYFLKNLAWSKLAKRIGFYTIEYSSTYDYALSFSGSERKIAQSIYDKLSESEISVFYDNNEQSRILSESVEEYLAPIYRSESRFIIPILSKNYPSRIWCKFEAEHFKERFGSNSVIPLWFSDCPTGMFDESNGKGGFTYIVENDMDSQINEFVQLLIDKIHHVRIEEASES